MINIEEYIKYFEKFELLYPKHFEAQICSVFINRCMIVPHQFLCTFTGTTKIKNLDQNLGALAVKLSEQDLREISEAVPTGDVAGTRFYNGMDQLSWKFANTPSKDSRVST